MTAFLGFEVNEGEYKVMGLASYGKPTHIEKLRKLVTLHDDGSFALDLSYFSYMHSDTAMYTNKMVDLLGEPRAPETPMQQHYMDIAASLQQLTEEAIVHVATAAKKITGSKNLCLAGGVAHNIIANARLHDSKIFDEVFIHFASGDSGSAIGAALYGYYSLTNETRHIVRPSPYLGPLYDEVHITSLLEKRGLRFEQLTRDTLIERTADIISENFVIGWFQGNMEFGPRALGNRSILANPCHPDMKNILNARVKHREQFRPFAPAVLAEHAKSYFSFESESPTMLYGSKVHPDKRELLPAVTHVDGTARAQTVRREDNPLFYDLIKAFEELTNVPVLINTSFNIRGEPIVCTPDDAINCFLGTDIDFLVLGNCLVHKT
jgi:carbamoyltransferase